jgi:uncharacterized protein (TIGR02271 family)
MNKFQSAFLVAVIILAAGCSTSGGGPRTGLSNARRITPLENRSPAVATTPRYLPGAAVPRDAAAQSYATGSAPARTTGTEVTEIPLYREELQVGKRVVPKGGVVLRKVVETDRRTQPVQLRREEIVIERVNGKEAQRLQAQGGNAAGAFQEREVLVELNREVPTVNKAVVVTEVVRARKVIDTRNETISETVRRENIDIDRSAANEQNEASGAGAVSERGSGNSNGVASTVNASASGNNQGAQTPQDQAELFLHQEELRVGKRMVPAGRVVFRKNVTREQVSRPIELREEDIRIERETVTNASARANAFAPREVFIPLQQEVPVVQKQVELSEVIRARKQIDTEQRVISDDVRRERVEVGETRNPNSTGNAAGAESGSESTAEQR